MIIPLQKKYLPRLSNSLAKKPMGNEPCLKSLAVVYDVREQFSVHYDKFLPFIIAEQRRSEGPPGGAP